MDRTLTVSPAAFARVILKAAELHEKSWDGRQMKHMKTKREAVVDAMNAYLDVPKEFVQPITYLLYHAEHETLTWADRILA
jgi:hypothetical protein